MTDTATWVDSLLAELPPAPGSGIGWLDALRQRALDRFATEGWPSTRQEGWRHTSLALIERAALQLRDKASVSSGLRQHVQSMRAEQGGYWLVFVDGIYVPELSDTTPTTPGVVASPLSLALTTHGDGVQARFGDESQGYAPAALSLALGGDGAYIHVNANVAAEAPIHLLFVSATGATVANPRNLITLESGAKATVVEHYIADPDHPEAEPTLTNAVTRTQVATKAELTHVKLQQERENAFHLALIDAEQAENSVFNSHSMSFGARLARNDIRTVFGGPHCTTLLNGLYYVNDRRHVDHNTLIDHAHPHGVSREYYRGILADMGRGVFGGRILVAPGADGTDAVQRSDSLLLSRMARADAKPELEIYADDVSCAHGATVGQIDEDAMFYLRTRGLEEAHARNLLTYAFAAQALNRLDLPVLREQVATMVRDRLPGGELLGVVE